MSNRRIEVIVGLVVLSALAILILGLLWLNRIEVGRRSYDIRVSFEDAGGLRVGDPVTVSGIEKGKVKAVALNRSRPGIVAVLLVDNDVELRRDAQFWLLDASLMGDKRIAVIQGGAPQPFDQRDTAIGQRAAGLMETAVKLGYLGDEAGQLVAQLKRDIATPENTRNIGIAIRNLTSATAQLNGIATENRAALKSIVQSTDHLLSPNEAKLDSTIQNLARASANLDSISRKINSGQGTAGQLVNNRELYDELGKTNKQLQDLISDIKANPKKYLTVKVF
ncbi:MAG TPA: MlaD family protein [Candidatus Edwardsbacteria bacterium]|nr:MlaD family protein [Candidatus Edwardsbacteria bacterium]